MADQLKSIPNRSKYRACFPKYNFSFYRRHHTINLKDFLLDKLISDVFGSIDEPLKNKHVCRWSKIIHQCFAIIVLNDDTL